MTKPKSKPQASAQPRAAKPVAAKSSAPQPRKPRATKSTTSKPATAETPPPAAPAQAPPPTTKLAILTALLQRKEGATVTQMMAATGWQAHSVRGALAGTLAKKFGAKVTSELEDAVRIYRAPAV